MNYSVINIDSINKSMMGNSDMIKQFVMLYLTQTPIDFKALEDSIASGDFKLISNAAHHIKPTMEYIGASELSVQFQEIETLGKENASIEIIREKFRAIKPKFDLMIEELQQII